jgi:hypothetical protein
VFKKIKEYLQVSDRISLLGVNEAREEHWITDEEDGCVVSNLKH